MKIFAILILSLCCLVSFGQDLYEEELSRIYMSGDLDQTIKKADEYLKNDSNNISIKLILGRALTEKGNFREAIPNLIYSVENDVDNSWKKAWALAYLGSCYFNLQDFNKSKIKLEECKKLKATKNVNIYADRRIRMFGFDSFYDSWKTVETDKFRFHFQKMKEPEINSFIKERELAFEYINNFFKSSLPKKIDFFVWQSAKDAKKILRLNLGFAYPENCIVHSYYLQTIGHEITHIISHYVTEISSITRFINEGTAVYFDMSNQDRIKQVHDWIKKNNKQIAIVDIWENDYKYDEEILYPLAGLFVKELIDNFGKEKFIECFKNQTYNYAKSILGDQLDKVIFEFEKKINI